VARGGWLREWNNKDSRNNGNLTCGTFVNEELQRVAYAVLQNLLDGCLISNFCGALVCSIL